MSGPRCWIVVACAQHLGRAALLGCIQVNHGKAAPLRRLLPGDRIAGYAPRETMGPGETLRCFVALGVVAEGPIVQVDMGGGFLPWRRPVCWQRGLHHAPVERLRAQPGFALAGPGWGAKLRFGLVAIDATSMDMIAAAMAAPA
jgi:hypothetical protein